MTKRSDRTRGTRRVNMGGGLKQASLRSFFGRGKPKGSTDGSVPTPPDPYENLAWAAGSSEYMVKGSGSHELEAQYIGSGTATFDTPAGLLLPDHEGVYVEIPENTPPWHGSRVVVQYGRSTDDLTQAWDVGGSAVVVDSETLDLEAAANSRVFNAFSPNGFEVTVSAMIRSLSGDPSIRFKLGGVFSPNITIDGTWKRYSYTGITSTDQVGFQNASTGGVKTVQIKNWQIEVVGGSTNKNPSEYCPNPDATVGSTVSKYFSNANGNTVTNNVVTEAVGAPLTVAPSLYAAPAMTNLVAWSSDCTQPPIAGNGWSPSSYNITYDQIGITGETNTASILEATDSVGTNVIGACQVSVATIVTWRCIVKASVDDWLMIRAASVSGAPRIWIDIRTGVLGTIGAGLVAEIDSLGNGWYALYLEGTTTSTAADLRFTATNANNNLNSNLGSAYINGSFEVYENKTIAQVKGSAPIVTEGAAVTNSLITMSYDVANADLIQSGLYAEHYLLDHSGLTSTSFIVNYGTGTASGRTLGILYNNTATLAQGTSRVSGSNTFAPLGPWTLGDWVSGGMAIDGANHGSRSSTNISWTEKATATPGTPAGLTLLGDNTFINTPQPLLIRNVQRWDLPYDEAKAKIDELME